MQCVILGLSLVHHCPYIYHTVTTASRFIVHHTQYTRQLQPPPELAPACCPACHRHRVPEQLRSEIHPKNILMMGPTGCGKTEIARRLAKLADAPFVKVCAQPGGVL